MCRVKYSLCLYLEHCVIGVNIFPVTFVAVDAGLEIVIGAGTVAAVAAVVARVGSDIVGAGVESVVLLAANPK